MRPYQLHLRWKVTRGRLTDVGGPGNPPPPPAVGLSSLRVPDTNIVGGVQTYDPSTLGAIGTPLRDWYEKAKGTTAAPGYVFMTNAQRPTSTRIAQDLAWDEKYNADQYKETRTFNGTNYPAYTGPTAGAYFLGRGHSNLVANIINGGLRASGDLRFLDVAAADGFHVISQMTKNDLGYFSLRYGVDPQLRLFYGRFEDSNGVLRQHPDNTAALRTINKVVQIVYGNDPVSGNGTRTAPLTNVELSIEESLAFGAYMRTALACHMNRDRYSPTYEPAGSRPATPQYYGKVADRAMLIFEDIRTNWRRKLTGNRRSLPLAMMNTLMHCAQWEISAYTDYAKIKYGDAWKTSPEYLQAARAFRLAFAESEKVGAGQAERISTFYEKTHPTLGQCVVISHHVARYKPSNTKTVGGPNDGEYTGLEACYPHKNDYTGDSYGAMMGMREEGCDFVTTEFLQKIANTVSATCLRTDEKYGGSNFPYNIHGNGDVPSLAPPTGWDAAGTSTRGSNTGSRMWTRDAFCHIAVWDTTGQQAARIALEYDSAVGEERKWFGATNAMMLYYAKQAGRLVF